MSIVVSNPVSGATVPGFTSPTYTFTADVAPNVHSKQWAVTSVGGTQAGVNAHSISEPFTVTFMRPERLRALPSPNPVTGKYPRSRGSNTFTLLLRKGCSPAVELSGLIPMRLEIPVPVGTDKNDLPAVRAAVSAFFGFGYANADEIAQALVDGMI